VCALARLANEPNSQTVPNRHCRHCRHLPWTSLHDASQRKLESLTSLVRRLGDAESDANPLTVSLG
jgi:hypothetical protein